MAQRKSPISKPQKSQVIRNTLPQKPRKVLRVSSKNKRVQTEGKKQDYKIKQNLNRKKNCTGEPVNSSAGSRTFLKKFLLNFFYFFYFF